MSRCSICLAITSLAMVSVHAQSSPKGLIPNSLTVSVVDLETGQAIPRLTGCAVVTFSSSSSIIELTMDDNFALAQLSAIEPGPYTLEVDTPGYAIAAVPVDVPESGGVIARIELSRTEITAGLEGKVLDSVSGNLLPASIVRIQEWELESAICNVGNYQFSDVPSSVYSVSASRTGYTPQSLRIAVDESSVSELDFALTADARFPGEIQGTVFDFSTGQPFPDARIRFNIASCDAEIATLTDSTGEYSVASLPPGPISITVEVDGAVEDFTTVTLGESEIVIVDFDVFDGVGGGGCASGGPIRAIDSSVLTELSVLLTMVVLGLSLSQRRADAR